MAGAAGARRAADRGPPAGAVAVGRQPRIGVPQRADAVLALGHGAPAVVRPVAADGGTADRRWPAGGTATLDGGRVHRALRAHPAIAGSAARWLPRRFDRALRAHPQQGSGTPGRAGCYGAGDIAAACAGTAHRPRADPAAVAAGAGAGDPDRLGHAGHRAACHPPDGGNAAPVRCHRGAAGEVAPAFGIDPRAARTGRYRSADRPVEPTLAGGTGTTAACRWKHAGGGDSAGRRSFQVDQRWAGPCGRRRCAGAGGAVAAQPPAPQRQRRPLRRRGIPGAAG
ncbi:hypothetical protein D3C72_1276450 [compost metagenome]